MAPKKPDFRFTVVAGSLKGRTITAPDLGVTRPPLTRLRRSIFDFLNPHLPGAAYLDLFSGTGSYLFEAVSRGVGQATGVELEPSLASAINRQAAKLGVGDQLECLPEDVFAAVPRLSSVGRRFDLVMIAPPQYQGLIDRALVTMASSPVVRPGGMVICQHDTSEALAPAVAFPLLQRRKYGNTTFSILQAGTVVDGG